MLTLDLGCGKNKRGDIGIDYLRDSDADIIADVHCLPLQDGVFDVVTSFTVMEHCPNPLSFLNEQQRVLKKNGKIVLVTDNAQFFKWSVFSQRYGGEIHPRLHSDHYVIFYPENAAKLFRMAGFRDLRFFFVRERFRAKIWYLARFFVRVGLWRRECLYRRFKVEGLKS